MNGSQSSGPTLDDVARRLVPHLGVVSVSQPTPALRTYNVVGIAGDAELGREAVLALEPLEHLDERLGTVVMAASSHDGRSEVRGADPEGVTGYVGPAILKGGAVGMIAGAVVIGAGALLFGARGWAVLAGAAVGALLLSVFGAIWASFARLGGSDAYRQTFVDPDVTGLTLVSVHTDDEEQADAAREALRNANLRTFDVDRSGHVSESRGSRAGSPRERIDRQPEPAPRREPPHDSGRVSVSDDRSAGDDVGPGDSAPDFSAPASTGIDLSLESFVGKVPVALTFTGPMPDGELDGFVEAMDQNFPRFGEQTIQVLLVLPESQERVRTRRKRGTKVPMISDADGALLATFAESATFPSTLVIDRSGTITRVVEGGTASAHVEQALAASSGAGHRQQPS